MLVTFTSIDDGGNLIAIRADYVIRVIQDRGKAVIYWRNPNHPNAFTEIDHVEEDFKYVVQVINEAHERGTK